MSASLKMLRATATTVSVHFLLPGASAQVQRLIEYVVSPSSGRGAEVSGADPAVEERKFPVEERKFLAPRKKPAPQEHVVLLDEDSGENEDPREAVVNSGVFGLDPMGFLERQVKSFLEPRGPANEDAKERLHEDATCGRGGGGSCGGDSFLPSGDVAAAGNHNHKAKVEPHPSPPTRRPSAAAAKPKEPKPTAAVAAKAASGAAKSPGAGAVAAAAAKRAAPAAVTAKGGAGGTAASTAAKLGSAASGVKLQVAPVVQRSAPVHPPPVDLRPPAGAAAPPAGREGAAEFAHLVHEKGPEAFGAPVEPEHEEEPQALGADEIIISLDLPNPMKKNFRVRPPPKPGCISGSKSEPVAGHYGGLDASTRDHSVAGQHFKILSIHERFFKAFCSKQKIFKQEQEQWTENEMFVYKEILDEDEPDTNQHAAAIDADDERHAGESDTSPPPLYLAVSVPHDRFDPVHPLDHPVRELKPVRYRPQHAGQDLHDDDMFEDPTPSKDATQLAEGLHDAAFLDEPGGKHFISRPLRLSGFLLDGAIAKELAAHPDATGAPQAVYRYFYSDDGLAPAHRAAQQEDSLYTLVRVENANVAVNLKMHSTGSLKAVPVSFSFVKAENDPRASTPLRTRRPQLRFDPTHMHAVVDDIGGTTSEGGWSAPAYGHGAGLDGGGKLPAYFSIAARFDPGGPRGAEQLLPLGRLEWRGKEGAGIGASLVGALNGLQGAAGSAGEMTQNGWNRLKARVEAARNYDWKEGLTNAGSSAWNRMKSDAIQRTYSDILGRPFGFLQKRRVAETESVAVAESEAQAVTVHTASTQAQLIGTGGAAKLTANDVVLAWDRSPVPAAAAKAATAPEADFQALAFSFSSVHSAHGKPCGRISTIGIHQTMGEHREPLLYLTVSDVSAGGAPEGNIRETVRLQREIDVNKANDHWRQIFCLTVSVHSSKESREASRTPQNSRVSSLKEHLLQPQLLRYGLSVPPPTPPSTWNSDSRPAWRQVGRVSFNYVDTKDEDVVMISKDGAEPRAQAVSSLSVSLVRDGNVAAVKPAEIEWDFMLPVKSSG